MALVPGARLGQYEIAAPIGKGGMGEVYRALDTDLGRQVAIKLLPDIFANDPERLARFEREAKTLALLNDPHIAQIYGLEKSGDVRALVLELVDGPTLADRIARGPIPIDEALPIARQIADALEAAHEQGIVHRDLKPANIKVRDDGTVKVLDFGLAKALTGPAGSAGSASSIANSPTITSPALMTGVGVILGTAAYMSPEQAKGREADRRSDIWAFGCVLHEMLTGKRAFPGDDLSETLAAVIKSEPDWTSLPKETPAPIHRLLRRCLQKDRHARLADASSLRIEIVDGQAWPDAEPPPLRSFRRERMAWMGGLALLALALAGTVAVAIRPIPGPPELRFEIALPSDVLPNSPVVSPDGRQIAFIVRSDARPRIWVQPLDGRPARPLERTDGAESRPFWSPDSRLVGFYAESKLKRIDVDSGAVQTLTDAPLPLSAGGAWSRDGVIVFSPTRGRLFRVSQAGGAASAVTRGEEPGVRHTSPQFLPDNRHMLFFSAGDPASSGVYVVDLDGSESRRILSDVDGPATYVATGHLLFARQGALLAQRFDADRRALAGEPFQVAESIPSDEPAGTTPLSASDAGTIVYRPRPASQALQRRLVWFDRSGKELRRLDDREPINANAFALSRDGRHLAVERQGSIWTLDAARGQLVRLTSGQGILPLWSLDGEHVVFQSQREGIRNLYQVSLTGGDEELLLATPGSKAALDWSPDGRLLLYRDLDPRTGMDLWVLPVERDLSSRRLRPAAGQKAEPVANRPARELGGQFSPDGIWVAYESDESGRSEIYLRPFRRPGRPEKVSTNGGTQVRWRRDGRELYYIGLDDRLMVLPVRLPVNDGPIVTDAPAPLFPVQVSSGISGSHQYAVSDDGQRFLVNVVTESGPDVVTVIVNWSPQR